MKTTSWVGSLAVGMLVAATASAGAVVAPAGVVSAGTNYDVDSGCTLSTPVTGSTSKSVTTTAKTATYNGTYQASFDGTEATDTATMKVSSKLKPTRNAGGWLTSVILTGSNRVDYVRVGAHSCGLDVTASTYAYYSFPVKKKGKIKIKWANTGAKAYEVVIYKGSDIKKQLMPNSTTGSTKVKVTKGTWAVYLQADTVAAEKFVKRDRSRTFKGTVKFTVTAPN